MSMPVTEDTPPDMLAGSMDLNVVLPNGQSVKMSIQRSTPMMDLLVQITTAHRLTPGNYSIQAMGDRGVLPYKPSTPIGALDTFTIKIVEKKSSSHRRAPQVPQNNFLNTFRLQVHLPKNQLFVSRVTPDVRLLDIMTHVCTEKCLDINKYELRNPGNLDEVLDLDKTLGDYKLQELSLVAKGNRTVTGLLSSADIINVKSSKHRQNSVCDSSLSSGSFGSRSVSPVPVNNMSAVPPQPPVRKKRRPAPKPPIAENEKKEEKTTRSVLISHSRESSDSSGYHEASVLSESPTHGGPVGRRGSSSPPDTLPRLSKLPPSQSFTNLTSIQPVPRSRLVNSVSNSSLSSNGPSRKKRVAPPPPVLAKHEEKIKSSTLPTEKRNIYNENNESDHLYNRSTSLTYPVEKISETKVEKNLEKPVEPEPEPVPVQVHVHVHAPVIEVVEETKSNVASPPPTAKTQEPVHPVREKVDVNSRPVPSPRSRTLLPAVTEDPGKKFPKLQLIRSNTDIYLASKLKSKDVKESSSTDDLDKIESDFELIKSWENSENLTKDDEVINDEGEEEVQDEELENLKSELESLEKEVEELKEPNKDERRKIAQDFLERSVSVIEKPEVPPKPVEILRQQSENNATDGLPVFAPRIGRWRNSETLACLDDDEELAVKSAWLIGDSDAPSEENLSPSEDPEQSEPDSLNWQYQLPPPPTDFRDTASPDCTEFGTITLTPDIYQEAKKQEIRLVQKPEPPVEKEPEISTIEKQEIADEPVILRRPEKSAKQDENTNSRVSNDVRLSQNKADVMNELTNVLNENRKFKEKSLSVSNLYTDGIKKKNALNYSRSFSIEPSFTLKNFKITTYEMNGMDYNRRLSHEKLYDEEISYKNYKNLEKSSSMECIKVNENRISEKSEEVFRKPIAPVQKKLKAKRSSSSVGIREPSSPETEEMLPEAVLREQFLEFLKEKKFMNNDLNPKSFEVLKSILPQLDSQILDNSQDVDSKEKVKIVEVKLKETVKEPEVVKVEKIERPEILRPKSEISMPKTEVPIRKSEVPMQKPEIPMQKPEIKRYSYQGPPSINFGTWGERPRTKIIIKDEDYITQDKLPEKKSEDKVNSVVPNYRELLRKPPPPTFKKPSNYEIFSALPKRKDISSIELIRLEEEERKRTDPSRVPVVCGVELKKDFKDDVPKPLKHSVSETSIKPEVKPKLTHSVSVYVNGNQENFTKSKPNYNFSVPKRSSLMPVVKGFRTVEENSSQSHVNNVSNKNNINNYTTNESSAIINQKSTSGGGGIPPPPPPVGLINLKPVASRQLKPKTLNSEDSRGQLMEEIRNFGGLKKLKTAQ